LKNSNANPIFLALKQNVFLPKVMMHLLQGSQVLDKEVKTNPQGFSQFNGQFIAQIPPISIWTTKHAVFMCSVIL
jgi:hypothetical protein